MLFALSSASAHAATYYVAPTGSNSNAGTQAAPFASLSYACTKATNTGDAININAGNYTDNSPCTLAAGVSITGAGSSSTDITSNYTGGYYITLIYTPALSGTGVTNGNQTISGFTLDGNNKTLLSGIEIIGYSHVTLNDLNLKHIHQLAIRLEGLDNWTNIAGINGQDYNVPPPYYGQYNTVSNVTITGCSWATNGDSGGDPAFWVQSQQYMSVNNLNIDETPSTTGGSGEPIKSWPGFINASTITNSSFKVGTSLPSGITSFDGGSTAPLTMEIWNWENGSVVSNSNFYEGYVSLVAGDLCGGQGSGSSTLISSCSATRALTFHDNNLIDTAYQGMTGQEFSLSNAEYYNNYIDMGTAGFWIAAHSFNLSGLSNISFHNNIVHNANGDSLIIESAPANVAISGLHIYNNTFDTAASSWPYSGVLVQVTQALTGLDIRNNIFMNFPGGGGGGYGVFFYTGAPASPIVSNNDYYATQGLTYTYSGATTPGITSANNISSNPSIVGSGSKYPYSTGTYYQLQGTSPMINAGANVSLPYTGSAPDIGAYEYGSATGADTTPPGAPSGFSVI